MTRVPRTDFAGALVGPQRTPQGGLRVDAALTRTGVFRYKDTSGREWGELRHPDDVFAADSLATLRAAPVVDLHPAQPVTAENFKALSVGHVHDDVRADGSLVAGTVTVNDAAEVALIEAKERRELSCGYTCTIESGAGEYLGERYDQRQRDIRYNHVGLGPVGWGRAGSEVALRLDGAAVQVSVRDRAAGETMKKLKVRGREFNLDADEEVAAAQGAVDQSQMQSDGELGAIKAALMDALQKLASYEAKAAASEAAESATGKPDVTEDNVPEAVADALVSKRIALHEDARKVLGSDAKLSGSVDAIRRQVIAKVLPSVKLDGLSGDAVVGMFTACIAGATQRNDGLARAHIAAAGTDGRHDGDEDPAATSRTQTSTRWQQPLGKSATAKGT